MDTIDSLITRAQLQVSNLATAAANRAEQEKANQESERRDRMLNEVLTLLPETSALRDLFRDSCTRDGWQAAVCLPQKGNYLRLWHRTSKAHVELFPHRISQSGEPAVRLAVVAPDFDPQTEHIPNECFHTPVGPVETEIALLVAMGEAMHGYTGGAWVTTLARAISERKRRRIEQEGEAA